MSFLCFPRDDECMVVLDACEDWRFAKNVSHRVSVLLVLSCPFFFRPSGFH